ncbi:hypothetical protein NC99_42160 [Sunxiuqinia dokdonensis]|uniref:Uncharacterized protein n=1 Tax=Sunxiuqinia dokdonensis TaxID=1409788 RepID=A0A0L8V3C2_9BACT|nr:hypothetical protein NC99_42160 [Sunxiuqinia dokdonensis]
MEELNLGYSSGQSYINIDWIFYLCNGFFKSKFKIINKFNIKTINHVN